MDYRPMLEEARGFWSDVARKYGWYAEPFHVQIWTDARGTYQDSVSYVGMPKDLVIIDGEVYEVD